MIDTHAHLMMPEFAEDREAVVGRAREAGLKAVINVGCGLEFSRQSVAMADGEFIYATVGLHPYDALDFSEGLMKEWCELIKNGKRIVAVGETGLDFAKAKVDHEKQKESFRGHARLAVDRGLPLIVHSRGAEQECLDLLREFSGVRAVFHCFGGDLKMARQVWEAGFWTSFAGIITYPSADVLRHVVAEAPLDKFMVETDCPYLAPQKYRGKRNEPAYVAEVVAEIARVKGISFEEVVKISTKNAGKFFDFSGF